jgi:PHD/YefM family antitoxin component YafN of YafNO toxin-antitoxin module
MTPAQLLTAQKIISTKHFQSKFASVVKEAEKNKNYYNVVRNSESIGVFLPTEIWESLLEDIEALTSPNYLRKIAQSRKEHKKGYVVDIDEAFDV